MGRFTYDFDEHYAECDRKHDDSVQRDIDDAAEAKVLAMAQRAAAGISPEILSMQDAFFEGARAGAQGNGASMNPYQDNTPEHHEWNRGRLSAIGATLNSQRRVA